MYKPCSFDREEYLSNKDFYEKDCEPGWEFDQELDEFNDDLGSIATELSYTRYALAKAEAALVKKESELVTCRLMEVDFLEGWAKFQLPAHVMNDGFHAGTAGINFSGVQD